MMNLTNAETLKYPMPMPDGATRAEWVTSEPGPNAAEAVSSGQITSATAIWHSLDVDALRVQGQGKEVVRIAHDGRIYWLGREVKTDADFRAAMMDLAQQLATQMRPA